MRNLAFWVVLMLWVLALFNVFHGSTADAKPRNQLIPQFVTRCRSQATCANVTLAANRFVSAVPMAGLLSTIRPKTAEVTSLPDSSIAFRARRAPSNSPGFQTFLMSLLPESLLLIGVMDLFHEPQCRAAGKGGAMGFWLRSTGQDADAKNAWPCVPLTDVAEHDEAKRRAGRDRLNSCAPSKKSQPFGGKIPKGPCFGPSVR